MPISDSDAFAFGLLALYAEDMHREADSGQTRLAPKVDKRLGPDWEAVAYLTANDAIFPVKTPMQLGIVRLYYGFVARSFADRSKFVVAVRGTSGLAEWIIDGQFFYERHVRGPNIDVEHGFWSIYSTMSLTHIDGTPIDADASKRIAALIDAATGGGGSVTVVGHSLGSALATYLSFDLCQRLGDRVGACLFASPRTGNKAWVDLYDRTLESRYRVINYILDLVPRLPTGPGYVTLNNTTILLPSKVDAAIRVDVTSNHHLLCYCAMLDYERAITTPLSDDGTDNPARAAILGLAATTPAKEAHLLEVALSHIDAMGLSVSAFFRTIIAFGIP